jgi:hypothetical protein
MIRQKNYKNELLLASGVYGSFYRSNRESIQNNQDCKHFDFSDSRFFRHQLFKKFHFSTIEFQKSESENKQAHSVRLQFGNCGWFMNWFFPSNNIWTENYQRWGLQCLQRFCPDHKIPHQAGSLLWARVENIPKQAFELQTNPIKIVSLELQSSTVETSKW